MDFELQTIPSSGVKRTVKITDGEMDNIRSNLGDIIIPYPIQPYWVKGTHYLGGATSDGVIGLMLAYLDDKYITASFRMVDGKPEILGALYTSKINYEVACFIKSYFDPDESGE